MYLWIDGLCIDQSNIPERNHQVRFLDDTYHRAVEIIISLGKYATVVAKLIKMMKHPADYDTSSQVHRNGFHIFLGHPYWKRLWTVQEVLLARNLTIMYGADTLAWHHLAECWDTI